ncbi:hypothetical protein [Isoptericola aurantiacus]|uniref:hypothetical protein n=1 Tax=Isoptericola aurantiacus TaxID=3377839 RepID=UPI00383B87B8
MPPVDHWDRDLAQDGCARITPPRRWLFLSLAASLVLFPLGLDLWLTEGANRMVAGLLLGVSLVGAVVSGWRIARPARLEVTPAGVRYRHLDLAWSDVAGVRDRTTSGNRFVVLDLTDDAAARLGGGGRPVRRSDEGTCVEVPGPFDHHDELVAWLDDVRVRPRGGGARRG